MQSTLTALAVSLRMAAVPTAQAQSSADFEALRAELRKLREEVNLLKQGQAAAAKPADSSGWGDRIEQLEIKAKDAVVLGDIGGGFRLPGSETSLRVYGYAEVHLINDIGRAGPSDNSTDLTFQPVGSEVGNNPALGLKGKTKLTAQTSRGGLCQDLQRPVARHRGLWHEQGQDGAGGGQQAFAAVVLQPDLFAHQERRAGRRAGVGRAPDLLGRKGCNAAG